VTTSTRLTDTGLRQLAIGRARDFRFILSSAATGAALTLVAGDKLWLTVKAAVGDAVSLFDRRNTAAGGSDAEIALVAGTPGSIDVKLVEANTLLLARGVRYPWELHYSLASDPHDRLACIGVFEAIKTAGNAIP
jgi:hypothetical protein